MIYRCENCINRKKCHENKKEYQNTCNTLEDIAKGLDRLPHYRCYYSLTIRCDYWGEDRDMLTCEAKTTMKGGE